MSGIRNLALVAGMGLWMMQSCSVALTPEGVRVRTVSEAERNRCELQVVSKTPDVILSEAKNLNGTFGVRLLGG